MKKKIIAPLILIILVMPAILNACAAFPAEQLDNAKQEIQKESTDVGPTIYDNGQNFLAVYTFYCGYDWATVVTMLQEWCNYHPDKRLVWGAEDYSSDVWVIYYEDK